MHKHKLIRPLSFLLLLGMLLNLLPLNAFGEEQTVPSPATGTDTLTVTKVISQYYGEESNDQVTLTDSAIPANYMTVFNRTDFCFRLSRTESEGGSASPVPLARLPYTVYHDGAVVGSGTTDDTGLFTLKNGQSAHFDTVELSDTYAYEVTEILSEIVWAPSQWEHQVSEGATATTVGTSLSNTSTAVCVSGTVEATEQLDFTCTNIYLKNPKISGDPITVVIDYGKPVKINVLDNMTYQGLSAKEKSTGKLTGVTVPYGGKGSVIDDDGDGIKESVLFTPSSLLSGIMKLTAKMEVTLANGINTTVSVPIDVVPATMMYYETDFAKNVFTTTAKGDGVEGWKTIEDDGTELTEDEKKALTASVQDPGYTTEYIITEKPGRENIPGNAFFADFEGNNSRYYTNSLYGGYDFDSESPIYWAMANSATPEILQSAGMMTLPVYGEPISFATTGTPGFYPTVEGNSPLACPLQMIVTNDFYIQLRFRLNSCIPTDEDPKIALKLFYTTEGESFGPEEILLMDYDPTETEAFQTLSMDLPLSKLSKIMTINAFELVFQGIRGEDGADASITMDYIFMGPHQGQERLTVTPNSLYFDFSNSKQDQIRYSATQYGATNFDIPENLALYNSNSSLTLSGGVAEVRIASQDPTHTYGFSTAPVGETTVYPLHYIPGNNDYLQIRYKLAHTASVRTDGLGAVMVELHGTKNGSPVSITYTHSFDVSQTANTGYSTWTIPMEQDDSGSQDYKSMDYVDMVSLRFLDLGHDDSASAPVFYVDYIYVGPVSKTAEQVLIETGDLFFGFTDMVSDQARYKLPQYDTGDKNYDLPGNWNIYNEETVIKGVSDGCIKFSPKADAQGETFGIKVLGNLNYVPDDTDYCEVRFKIEDAVATRTDEKARFSVELVYSDNTTSVQFMDFEAAEYIDNGYYLLSVPLKNGVHETKSCVKWLRLYFSYISSPPGKTAIFSADYIRIGPKSPEYQRSMPETTTLFIDFTNTDADKMRYSGIQYGGYNFDLETTWRPEVHYNEIHYIENGVIYTTLREGASIRNKEFGFRSDRDIEHDPNRMVDPLRVYAGEDYVAQYRIRLDGVKSDRADNKIHIDFDIDSTNILSNDDQWVSYDWYVDADEIIGQGFVTITVKLNSDSLFFEMEYISLVHPQMGDLATIPGQKPIFAMDYIYIGPLSDAPIPEKCLYFGFDNLEEDRERYTDKPYNNVNFDDEDTLHWETESLSEEGLELDNLSGTLTLTDPTGTVDRLSVETSDPLTYRPENAQVLRLRFKMEGFAPKGDSTLSLFYDAGTGGWEEAMDVYQIDPHYLDNDYYLTIIRPLNDNIRRETNVNSIQLRFDGLQDLIEGTPGKVILDHIYIGPAEEIPDPVYGYDSSYLDDSLLSNGTSLFVEGAGYNLNGTATKYTEVSFKFKGTGFDIISRTGPKQATLDISVKDSKNNVVKHVTLNNKGELDLYQIPVFSLQGLKYGTYTVVIGVKAAVESNYEFLNRGGEFYFDAVRIYSPIDTTKASNSVALGFHNQQKEGLPHIKEVRNLLLEAADFDAITDETQGALFVDMEISTEPPVSTEADGSPTPTEEYDPNIQVTGHISANVYTYNKVGPKNEVYLDPGQAVVFKLQFPQGEVPVSMDLGVKTITDGGGNVAVGFVTKESDLSDPSMVADDLYVTIHSCTSQYYALDTTAIAESQGKDLYLVIYNDSAEKTSADAAANRVISITDIKIVFEDPAIDAPEDETTDPEIWPESASVAPNKRNTSSDTGEMVQFFVDNSTTKAAETFVRTVVQKAAVDTGALLRHSLNLASDISINYILPKALLEHYEEIRLECVLPVYDRNYQVGSRKISLFPVEKGSYYYFTLDGLTAVHTNDMIQATLHMSQNGRDYYSPTDSYSIATYAYAMLNQSASSAELKALCAELLRYGAAAQLFKGYRASARGDAAMTEEQLALLTPLEDVSFGVQNVTMDSLDAPTVGWIGKSLDLNSRVGVKFIVDLSSFQGDKDSLALHVTYTNVEGTTVTAEVRRLKDYLPSRNWYAFSFDDLLAAELRTTLSVAVFAGEEQVSQSLLYRPDTYGNGTAGTLGELCRALFAYSDKAKAYFSSK